MARAQKCTADEIIARGYVNIAKMADPIVFYFDFISPYAYLAWTQIHKLAERHQREVDPIPVLFAALLDHHGQKGPAEIPPKRVYIFKHVLRLAHELGVELSAPAAHPFNPLLALRVAVLDMSSEDRRRVIDTLYSAVWHGGHEVTNPHTVAEILTEAGFDGKQMVEAADQPTIKDLLRANTAVAVERGVFGVPTMVVDGEVFWGLDSFSHIDAFLTGTDPLSDEVVERFRTMPAQAKRPGS